MDKVFKIQIIKTGERILNYAWRKSMLMKQASYYLLIFLLIITFCNKDNITGTITLTNDTNVAFDYTVEPSG